MSNNVFLAMKVSSSEPLLGARPAPKDSIVSENGRIGFGIQSQRRPETRHFSAVGHDSWRSTVWVFGRSSQVPGSVFTKRPSEWFCQGQNLVGSFESNCNLLGVVFDSKKM